jgi:hypothetical protein
VCSECGHALEREADAHRTRRAPARAVLAVVGVIAIVGAMRVRLLDRGAWSMAPTSVLLLATPHLSDGGYRSAAWELAYRIRTGESTAEQAREAVALFVEGDAEARPPSSAWQAKYRDLGSAVQSRIAPTDPLMQRLLEIPPRFELGTIAGCTIGDRVVPALLIVDAEVWWPPMREGRLEVTLPDGTVRRGDLRPDGRFPSLVIELPPAWATGDAVTLALAQRPIGSPDSDRGFEAYPSVQLTPLEAPAAAPPQWSPADTPELRDAVRAVFDEGLLLWSSGSTRAGLRFNHRVMGDDAWDGLAVGVRVDVLEDGVVRRTSRMWWRAGTGLTQPLWLPSIEDEDAMRRLFELGDGTAPTPDVAAGGAPESASPRWTLRIRGDEGLAHYAAAQRSTHGAPDESPSLPNGPERASWFAGEVEVPLRVERIATAPPVRRWRLR